MDRTEAIRVLSSYRPSFDATVDPRVAEALAFIEGDAELKAWWHARQAFDQKVTAKLQAVPIPPHLRQTILAGRKVVAPPSRFPAPAWLALAALIAVLCVAGTMLHMNQSVAKAPIPTGEYMAEVLPLVKNDAPDFAMTSSDNSKLVAWLKDQHAPTGGLPPKLGSLPGVGCQRYTIKGHDVSLICFSLTGGGIAHLFIIKQQALANPPTVNVPEFAQKESWSTAAWSDGSMSYVLATQSGPDALKQLL